MESEKMREEFEAWARSEGLPLDPCPCAIEHIGLGDYMDEITLAAWSGWKASRESLVIELPPVRPEPKCEGGSDGEAASWNIWVGDKLAKAECREAIEAAGLKVKP